MISVYVVHPFFGVALIKCNENTIFSFRNTQIMKRVPFCLKTDHELRVQIQELRVQIREFKNHLINENVSKQS